MEAPSQSAAMPAPTLEFAAICLRNALFLLPSPSSLAVAQDLSPIDGEEGGGDHSSKSPSVSALPGVPIVRESIQDLRLVRLGGLSNLGLKMYVVLYINSLWLGLVSSIIAD